ncbi:poly [ADP-ribose] polymerase [uncultured Caudovirales phage]|uniref:Poly [ADP-ribose] polymerase n=1 Tax=uncultured Caudovirales phage TaxID=2100421 RepID=A0A6J5RJ26_9CAUD|nr:poly [ADP-ribose] polymerase [uncultured Caudovirales phage]
MKCWKENEFGEPKFPSTFEIVKKAVLQVTDIKTNRNKYYAVELHSAKSKFRVYTHYGRTDDLDSNPDAGIRESRYCSSLSEAESIYNKIFSEKTSARKGYKEINLASSKIGSKKSFGQSSGDIDEKTLKKLSEKSDVKIPVITIAKPVQDLVSLLYLEATNALKSTVNVNITANGIETPLGVLTIGQIDKGQEILDQIASFLSKKKKNDLVDLSGEFYTCIPHKFGRSRDAAADAVIDSSKKLNDKQDTLQLMRDMLNVNGSANVLLNPEIEKKYQALNCGITCLDKKSDEFKKIQTYINKEKHHGNKILNIFTISRDIEEKEFTTTIKNNKLLFHGSNAKNWVGILSRGILLPKTVVKLGVHRTDSGWLGHGIYFGDVISTSSGYAGPSKKGSSYVALTEVALGNIKKYTKVTPGLVKPPDGYDSCHGVSGTEFHEDEFVIYNTNQQKLKYLIECE